MRFLNLCLFPVSLLFVGVVIAMEGDLNNLASALCDLSAGGESKAAAKKVPSWREAKVYERTIGSVNLVVVVGDATSLNEPNSGSGPMLTGNMLNQDADVVVDAANGDIDPGSGVSGALYAAVGRPNVDKVWRSQKPPLAAGQKGVSEKKRLNDGAAWFNSNPAVLAYSPDKGTGAPQNIMRIIHAVAPICGGSKSGEIQRLLISAYKNSLTEMDAWLHGAHWLAKWNAQRQAAGVPLRGNEHRPTIVFPLLGAGVFRCDPKMVAQAFLNALTDYIKDVKNTAIGVVVLAPFNAQLQEAVLEVVRS
ncbi:MAG: macro domain-containing protein [Candidatus Dependentiae bacterium]|nr:macro domain-containing protein [Candidatus Dependentiae bacterium]